MFPSEQRPTVHRGTPDRHREETRHEDDRADSYRLILTAAPPISGEFSKSRLGKGRTRSEDVRLGKDPSRYVLVVPTFP